MFIGAMPRGSALRQEGNGYRTHVEMSPPSVRRAMFIERTWRCPRPPSGGQCLIGIVRNLVG